MTKQQLSAAVSIAKDFSHDLSNIDDSIMFGYALQNFKPITVTVEQLAKCVRWQCFCLNGNIDAESLNEFAEIGRKKFMVV